MIPSVFGWKDVIDFFEGSMTNGILHIHQSQASDDLTAALSDSVANLCAAAVC